MHEPAAVGNVARFVADGPGDFGGAQIVDSLEDGIGQAESEEVLVFLVGIALKNADHGGSGMGVGGGHEDVVGGEADLIVDDFFGSVENFAVDEAVIGDDESDAGGAVIEDDAAGVKLVVEVGAFVIVHVAIDGNPHPR